MFSMAGTVKNSVKLATLENKWQQKKENAGKPQRKELTAQERELQIFQEQADEIREGKTPSDISAKLMSGARLTQEEIEYLRKNAPEALKEYEEFQREREQYKRQLRNCKSKEEVERLKTNKMGQFLAEAKEISHNAAIPKAKKVELLQKLLKKIAGVEEEHTEFTKTLRFAQLPEEEEEKDNRRKAGEQDGKAEPDTTDAGLERVTGAAGADNALLEKIKEIAKKAVPAGSVIDVSIAGGNDRASTGEAPSLSLSPSSGAEKGIDITV